MQTIKSICVYCGSSPGTDPVYQEAGAIFGQRIAEAGLRLVFGGGTRGIMGAVSSACLQAGGKVTGIIPEFLLNKEAGGTAPGQFDELVITDNMHQRKHIMFEKSDAFVALPGGIGTLEEIVEILTWAQLGHHEKPIVFANINGFWDPMLGLLRHMREQGFVHSADRAQILVSDSVEEILALIWASAPSMAEGDEKVIDRM